MATDITLTICIPIYNCAEYIGEALDSILPQTSAAVDVVIYDGGSTDHISAVMEAYLREWPNLSYYRSLTRGGIDADLAKCVQLASGKYCWLFSGDDVMRPKAVLRALHWIAEAQDVYVCKHTICSKEMLVSHEHSVLQPDVEFKANLSNPTERSEWFRRAVTSEAFFSFMSSLIVRRRLWLEGELPSAFDGSCWGHVARLFGLAQRRLLVCYVAEIWLDKRGDNDSFLDKGVVNRYKIGIEGYHRLADKYWMHGSIEAFHIRRVIRHEFPFKIFMLARLLCIDHPSRESRQELNRLIALNYSDDYLMKNILLFIPDWFVIGLISAHRSMARLRRRIVRA